MHDYVTRLHSAIRHKATPALVGLDPREDSLPEEIRQAAANRPGNRLERLAWAYETFCRGVIDAVAPIIPAVKPQVAFFEDAGPPGIAALQSIIRYARTRGLIVIADAKRGDIGTTAHAYANAWLAGEDPDASPFAADALTVNPYLGPDTLLPFVEIARARGAGLYVLVRTSNPQSGVFQQLTTDNGQPVHAHVAREVQSLAQESQNESGYGCVGAVVGATYPAELALLRKQLSSSPLLVPGYGAQGGTAADVAAAFDASGLGALVNSSRNVIFGYRREAYRELAAKEGWQASIEAAAREFIEDLRAHTPAGVLTCNE
jgi:orotidine-5'-phosphate decarboxylase